MTWKVPKIIAELSTLFELAAGDLIYTGTPAGVGPLVRGDAVECGIDGLDPQAFESPDSAGVPRGLQPREPEATHREARKLHRNHAQRSRDGFVNVIRRKGSELR